MKNFDSEYDLISVLDQADAVISEAVSGRMDIAAFFNELWRLYGYYALDGHESDHEERQMLDLYSERINWIAQILSELNDLCSEEDALKETYIKSGRFGSAEALRRLRGLVENKTRKDS